MSDDVTIPKNTPPPRLPNFEFKLIYCLGFFTSLTVIQFTKWEWLEVFQTTSFSILKQFSFTSIILCQKSLKRKSLYFSENISCLGALAISIPQLDNFISLIGAIASAALALIFPPILNTMCFWNHGISKFEIVKNISISLFGIVGAVTGTFISIEAIIIGFTTYKGDLIVREGMVGEFYQIVLNDTLTWL